MIDDLSTFLCFGYYSSELTNGSDKRIWAVCDDCGKYRLLKNIDYRDLCKSCVQRGRFFSEEHRRKIGKAHTGKIISKETRKKLSENYPRLYGKDNPNYGKTPSKETLKKMRENRPDMSGEKNPFYGKHHTEESKRKMSIDQSTRTRERNPRWDINKTDEDREIGRKYPEYYEWRKRVFARDNYTCQNCNSNSSVSLNAHHLESYANNVKLRIILSNGVTLCKECHKNFHRQYGMGNNTKEQFIEFMGN